MNGFARPDGAWLLCDTASFNDAGQVIGFDHKVVFSRPLRAIVGFSGRVPELVEGDIAHWMYEQPDQLALLAALPGLVEIIAEKDEEAVANGGLLDNPLPTGFRLTVALWNAEEGRARVAVMASNDAMGATIGSPAKVLRPTSTIFSPPVAGDPWPGHSFDPLCHGAALAKAQRQAVDERGIHRVGGSFEAWRVHGGGIEQHEIARWPNDHTGSEIRTDLDTVATLTI